MQHEGAPLLLVDDEAVLLVTTPSFELPSPRSIQELVH